MTRYLYVSDTVVVRHIAKENRAPHINFIYQRYVGGCLCDPALVGKKITIKYPIHDIRTLRCYAQDGTYLGEVVCPKSWMRYPHTRKTRTLIYRISRNDMFCGDDPVGEYFSWLLESPHENSLEIIRIVKETGGKIARVEKQIPPNNPTLEAKHPSQRVHGEAPKWDISMVRRGVDIEGEYSRDNDDPDTPASLT